MRFKTLLLKLAKTSQHPRYRHAAIVAKGKRILGQGINEGFIHAEENALADALHTHDVETVAGSTVYTLMIKTSNDMGNGSPCDDCMGIMRLYDVRKVIVYV